MSMIALLLLCWRVFDNEEIKEFSRRIVPKLLCFEPPWELRHPVIRDMNDRADSYTVTFVCNKDTVTFICQQSGSVLEPVWAEWTFGEWTYLPVTKARKRIAEKFVSSKVPWIGIPAIVRITSHRERLWEGELHVQMTIIVRVYEQKQLHLLHFKIAKRKAIQVSYAVVDKHPY